MTRHGAWRLREGVVDELLEQDDETDVRQRDGPIADAGHCLLRKLAARQPRQPAERLQDASPTRALCAATVRVNRPARRAGCA